MKKSTLALSVAAAIGGLGFIGSASAIGTVSGATATTMSVNADGIGHQLLFPYFTAQSDNATLFNITNTDVVNGKVVKVRFRGAANSDDLYDFTLLLSPGDVWTASVTKDATTGLATLKSTDNTCVLPAGANSASFATTRIDPQAAVKANETREGYVEVITMADVPVDTAAGSLYTAIKHVAGKAPCTSATLEAKLGTDVADVAAAALVGMTPPSGGLTGDWIVLNQTNTAAWSGTATALRAGTAAFPLGNLVFWPQKFGTPTNTLTAVTADPLLVQGVVAAQNYDLPDLSTPYVTSDAALAATRADATSATLAIKSLKHQIVTTTDIAAVTDVVVSQPTRRYSVGVNYTATAAADGNVATTGTLASAIYRAGTGSASYNAANTSTYNRQVCLDTINAPGVKAVFDREETTPTVGTTNFVISPNVPSAASVMLICGEASVLSVNQGGTANASGALSATVARSDVTFDAAYTSGWATWDLTPNTTGAVGIPVLGATFMRAQNGTVNYGFAFSHKAVR